MLLPHLCCDPCLVHGRRTGVYLMALRYSSCWDGGVRIGLQDNPFDSNLAGFQVAHHSIKSLDIGLKL